MTDSLIKLLNEKVVLDTGTPIVYIGTLIAVSESTLELLEADMHDCRDGHASKDLYLVDTRDEGITVNRRRVIVMRSAVISVSRVEDIVNE